MLSDYKLEKIQRECGKYFYDDRVRGQISCANTVYALCNELMLYRSALERIAHDDAIHDKEASKSKSAFAKEVLDGKHLRIE